MKKAILKSEAERKGVSAEMNAAYAAKLSRMIDCKTVWNNTITNHYR